MTTSEIANQEYVLTPGRYVGIAEIEDDREPFEEKMDRLTSEMHAIFEDSHRLEEELFKKLSIIGF